MSSYNNHQSQDEIRKYFSSETPENIVQFLFIGNNLKTFYVLLDRAAWLRKGHDALLADGMAIIRKLNPRIPSGEISRKPMYVAYTYASLVFYVSAIESFLLLIYANSVVLLFNWKGIIPDKLRVSLENKKQKRDLRSINEELRTLSHVNLIEADKWLSEIYGIPFFDTVLGNAEFKEFRIRFDDLSSKRNDIVHRGGENKKGKYTDVNFDELDLFHADAEKFGKKTAQFLYQWWVGRFQENPDLVKAVFKSI